MVNLNILEKIKARFKVFDVITYKDVYSLLDEPPKTGNSRKAQWNEIERYMKLEQVSRSKKQIVEIYDTPREKVDNRGKHENSQQALKEYNNSNKTFQDDIIIKSIRYSHFMSSSSILGIPIMELIQTNNDNIFTVKNRPFELFENIGLCNKYTKETLENRKDLIHNTIFLEYDIKPSYIVTNNLFNSMKNKLTSSDLKDIISYGTIIFYNGESRQALSYEEQIIKQVEQEVMKEYNERHNTTYKYSDIYYLSDKQRMTIQNTKKHRLMDKIMDYENDVKCFFIHCSIKSDIEELNLNNMTKEEIIQLGEYLRQQINTIYYENEKDRITNHYNKQIDEILQSKSYGNVKNMIDKLEQDKEKSLELLKYLVKVETE